MSNIFSKNKEIYKKEIQTVVKLVLGLGIILFFLATQNSVDKANNPTARAFPIDLCNFNDFDLAQAKLVKPKDCPKSIGAITQEVGYEKLAKIDGSKLEPKPSDVDLEASKNIKATKPLNKEQRLKNIEAYKQKFFSTSPVSSQFILDTAIKYNFHEGFILAVGHNESHMGTKGRAVQTMNPMNVGNTDAGDHKPVICGQANNCLNNYEQGVIAFVELIRNKYFYEGEEITLTTWVNRDFRAVRGDVAGKRYMTDINAYYKYQERINNLNNLDISY